MKVLIFGKGFLGTRIAEELGYLQTDFRVTDSETTGIYLDTIKPDAVINAVGKTGGPGAIGIDWCENHKEETVQSNVIAPAILATECSRRGIYFVHLGSGCIYKGDNHGKGFTEEDSPNFYGSQFYAMTKIDAERILKNFSGLVLRLRMPIDNRPHSRNLIDKLKGYPEVIDIPNSMTTVPDMIPVIGKLIQRRTTGIYNFTNPGTISAFEIMVMYRELVNPEHKFKLLSRERLNAITAGERSNCYLNTDKLMKEGIFFPEIHVAVRSCLMEYARCSKC